MGGFVVIVYYIILVFHQLGSIIFWEYIVDIIVFGLFKDIIKSIILPCNWSSTSYASSCLLQILIVLGSTFYWIRFQWSHKIMDSDCLSSKVMSGLIVTEDFWIWYWLTRMELTLKACGNFTNSSLGYQAWIYPTDGGL